MTTNTEDSDDSGFGLAAAATAVFMWASGNLIVREAPLSGVQIAFWRVLLGATVYLIALRVVGRRLTWQQLRASAPAAISLATEIAVFFVAIKVTTVANTTVIGSLQPIVLMLFGVRRFGEKVSSRLIVLASVAVVGAAIVVYGSSSQAVWTVRGDGLAFIAMLLFAAYFYFAKRARLTVPAFEFQAAIWVWGSVVLLPAALIDAGGLAVPSWIEWRWLAAVMLIAGSGHQLMNWAHAHIKLSTSSLLTLTIPAISAGGAALILNESLSPTQLVGMGVVLVALAAAIRHNTHRRSGAPQTVR